MALARWARYGMPARGAARRLEEREQRCAHIARVGRRRRASGVQGSSPINTLGGLFTSGQTRHPEVFTKQRVVLWRLPSAELASNA